MLQASNVNPRQHDVDAMCAAEVRGRHEQQLITLDKSQEALRDSFEKGQEILRSDFKDLATVITKSIDDKHSATVEYFRQVNADIATTKVSVAEIKTQTQDNADEIKDIKDALRNVAIWIITGLISGIIGVLVWFFSKIPISIGG